MATKKLTLKNYHFIAKYNEWITDSCFAIMTKYSPDLGKFQYLIDENINACYTSPDYKVFNKVVEIPKINQLIPKNLDDRTELTDTSLFYGDKVKICVLYNNNKDYYTFINSKYLDIVKHHKLKMFQDSNLRGIVLVDKDSNICGLIMPTQPNKEVLKYLDYEEK